MRYGKRVFAGGWDPDGSVSGEKHADDPAKGQRGPDLSASHPAPVHLLADEEQRGERESGFHRASDPG